MSVQSPLARSRATTCTCDERWLWPPSLDCCRRRCGTPRKPECVLKSNTLDPQLGARPTRAPLVIQVCGDLTIHVSPMRCEATRGDTRATNEGDMTGRHVLHDRGRGRQPFNLQTPCPQVLVLLERSASPREPLITQHSPQASARAHATLPALSSLGWALCPLSTPQARLIHFASGVLEWLPGWRQVTSSPGSVVGGGCLSALATVAAGRPGPHWPGAGFQADPARGNGWCADGHPIRRPNAARGRPSQSGGHRSARGSPVQRPAALSLSRRPPTGGVCWSGGAGAGGVACVLV